MKHPLLSLTLASSFPVSASSSIPFREMWHHYFDCLLFLHCKKKRDRARRREVERVTMIWEIGSARRWKPSHQSLAEAADRPIANSIIASLFKYSGKKRGKSQLAGIAEPLSIVGVGKHTCSAEWMAGTRVALVAQLCYLISRLRQTKPPVRVPRLSAIMSALLPRRS